MLARAFIAPTLPAVSRGEILVDTSMSRSSALFFLLAQLIQRNPPAEQQEMHFLPKNSLCGLVRRRYSANIRHQPGELRKFKIFQFIRSKKCHRGSTFLLSAINSLYSTMEFVSQDDARPAWCGMTQRTKQALATIRETALKTRGVTLQYLDHLHECITRTSLNRRLKMRKLSQPGTRSIRCINCARARLLFLAGVRHDYAVTGKRGVVWSSVYPVHLVNHQHLAHLSSAMCSTPNYRYPGCHYCVYHRTLE